MGRIQHIMCAVDLRDVSPQVIQQATALASVHRADLLLVYVFNAPLPLRLALSQHAGQLLDTRARAEFLSELDTLAAPIRELGLSVRTRVCEGRPAPELVGLASTLKRGLIVLGTHGRSGVGRLVLGSVAEETIRSAGGPVMTVGPQTSRVADHALPDNWFRHILCPTDLSPESRAALDLAITLAEAVNGTVRVLHVVEWWVPEDAERLRLSRALELRETAVQEARAQLEAFVPARARHVELLDVVVTERPYTAVLDEANVRPTDLIALGVRGRGRVDVLLAGSTTNRVVREARCPVLTVRGDADADSVAR